MEVPDRGRVRCDVDAHLDHLAPGDAEVVLLQAGAPQSRRLLDRRARDAAVLLGRAHFGLPEGVSQLTLRVPSRRRAREEPWRLTLAFAVSWPSRPACRPRAHVGRLYPPFQGSYAAVKAMAQLRRS